MKTDVRGDPTTLDGPWMTEALEGAGVARGATVTDVRFDRFVGTGQMSRNARLSLTWDEPDGRPATVIGKFPSDDATARAASFESGIYFHEFSFYSELAPTVDVRTPKCWVARFDEDEPDFVLIMEDLADSEQGDQLRGCTTDEAALAVEQAVGLHAPRWGDPALVSAPALQPADDGRAEMLDRYYSAAVGVTRDRLGHRLDDDVMELVERFAPVVSRWSHGTGSPHTIAHGDFRPDNFLFGRTPEAPPLAVVDWQTVFKGLGTADLAYLIGGAFTPDQRAAVENDLVEDYRRRLGAAGVTYGPDECWRDYRWGTLHGVLIAVCAVMMAEQTERGDDMLTLMVSHHGRHAIDLEALALFA
jgi:hypothetical protein